MTLDEALRIVDPETVYDALKKYPFDCDILDAKVRQASRMVVDAYKAAFRDLTYVAKNSQDFDCACGLCAGGMGKGNCVWPEDKDMPINGCEKCGKCQCSRCTKELSKWEWYYLQEVKE